MGSKRDAVVANEVVAEAFSVDLVALEELGLRRSPTVAAPLSFAPPASAPEVVRAVQRLWDGRLGPSMTTKR